jgi:acetyl-CoA synthetase
MLRTIWGDNARYVSTYWEKFKNRLYVAGDSAHRDKDNYYWIMGRIDDVLNVAGHRLGTMEVESALVSHPRVAEAAVVGKPHEIKGEGIFAYVVCRGTRPSSAIGKKLTEELRAWVAKELGAIAKPDEIRFTDNLPKTRSGKIMRRLLRAVARGEEITQDISTLENPAIIDQLRGVETSGTQAKSAGKKSAKKKSKAARKARPRHKPKPLGARRAKPRAAARKSAARTARRRKAARKR